MFLRDKSYETLLDTDNISPLDLLPFSPSALPELRSSLPLQLVQTPSSENTGSADALHIGHTAYRSRGANNDGHLQAQAPGIRWIKTRWTVRNLGVT